MIQVVSKGRLGPGQMIACDLVNGGFEDNWSIKQKVAAGRPYGEWIKQYAKVCFENYVHTERRLLCVERVHNRCSRKGKRPSGASCACYLV